MYIKEVRAFHILDSRREKTIAVKINGQVTSAPSGKSVGKHEFPAYKTTLAADISFINKLKTKNLPEVSRLEDLEKIEKLLRKNVGANTLFCFESSILKALAKENKKDLWNFLNPNAHKIPLLLSNTVGGGAHSSGKKQDFQEFLVIGNSRANLKAYNEAGKLIHAKKKNDEHAWMTHLSNEEILALMKFADTGTGADIAASQFYKNGRYYYKNKPAILTRAQQINYVLDLIEETGLDYVEDPLNEDDFSGFSKIQKSIGKRCLIVGDDLTVTNFARVKKAIAMKSVSGVIIKPNQTGSLLEVKKIIDLCKKNGIKTIMSHRSGETMDNTISDLAVAWRCDFMKIPVVGRERQAKVRRLLEIERKLK